MFFASPFSLRTLGRSTQPHRRFRPQMESLGSRICPSTTETIPPPEPAETEETYTTIPEPGTPEYDDYMNWVAGTTTDPATTDPMAGDPMAGDPMTTDPMTGDPGTTDPMPSDPNLTDPAFMEESAAPVLNLQIEMLQGNTVRLYGTVIAESPAECWLFFSGAASAWTNPDASGNFSIEVQATWLGEINGVAISPMGVPSSGSTVMVTSDVPVIQEFTAIQETGNLWSFTGTVVDESAAGLTVYFGGILSGHSATVQADGTFTLCVEVTEGGIATAMVMDWWWQMSDFAETLVVSA